jgi:hypothetical protein
VERWSPRGAWEVEVNHVYGDGTIGSVEVTFADGSRWGIDVPSPPGEHFTVGMAESAVQSLIDHGEFFDNVEQLPSSDAFR